MGTIERTATAREELEVKEKNLNKSGDASHSKFPAKLRLPEYRRKVLRTLWLAGACWAMGLSTGIRGPSFLDIQIITQTTLESASAFLTASYVGNLLGAVFAGVIYDKLNKSCLLIMIVIGLSLTNIALPWCSPYGLMVTIHILCTLFSGAIDTACNAELLRIWGQEGRKSMQFMHFSFAFGGVLAPLITEPFLTSNPETDDATNRSEATAQNITLAGKHF
ncbi:major facilitator superfamily domain-containing protein 4A-like isoform X2 [Pomacea canaliculata]|nr:major facilitator superfamily domain-containing protein 4A-like isoform X2 [Pomacea canaliculata]XP_025094866.1 major facilitator superfamily domain-containing protein 4A-like isoform X2 [Pomacea canaliculata]XP_025094867.1 major facilitator superfamily domain-containing protein 4A-like isoform X2 [Pomacea canaliculata]